METGCQGVGGLWDGVKLMSWRGDLIFCLGGIFVKLNKEFYFFFFQFDLVCSDDYLITISQSVYMLGILVGVVVSGILSDK